MDNSIRIKGQGRIKIGTAIFHNMSFQNWPHVIKPMCLSEHDKFFYETLTVKDPDMIFDVEWNGTVWRCTAPGFGYPEDSGTDFIVVRPFDGVELTEESKKDNHFVVVPCIEDIPDVHASIEDMHRPMFSLLNRMIDPTPKTYGLEEWDDTMSDPYEAVQRILSDNNNAIEWPVELQIYKPKDLGDDMVEIITRSILEDTLTYLDENFGDISGDLYSEPTDNMREAARAFSKIVVAEYVPMSCDFTGDIRVVTEEEYTKHTNKGDLKHEVIF